MKKKLLLIVSAFIGTMVMAQQSPSFGVRMGVTASGMQGDAVSSLNNLLDYTKGSVTTGTHTGFFAGAYTHIPVSDYIVIEPALYYTQKGYEMNGALNIKGAEFLGMNAKALLNTQYIDLPVVVKGTFNGFEVFAGPQISYLAAADLKTTAGLLGFNVLNSKTDATAQLNKWDAAITGGIGYHFANGLNVMASYDYGLMKADANQNLNAYNRSVKVGVGFTF